MHVMIIPTMGCPANCSYCWSSEVESEIMSKETVDNLIDWLKDFKNEATTFTFHGGEPLLAGYDYYEYTLDRIANDLDFLYPAYAIQTNLWLMDDEIASLFKKYEIPIGSSLDGPKKLNDLQRGVGYFDKTIKGHDIAKKHDLRVSFISTFTNYSINHKEEIFNFFKDNGYPMKIHPALPSIKSHSSDDFALDVEDYAKLMLYLLDEYLDLADKIELKNLDHLCKGVFMQRGCVCTYVDCMGSTFAIGPDGSIYPCYRFVGMDDYVIGHVSDMPTYEELMDTKPMKLLDKFRKFVDEDCSGCKHIKYCRGGCPYNALVVSDHEVKCVDPYCMSYKTIFDEINRQMNENLDMTFGFNMPTIDENKKQHKFSVMDIALKGTMNDDYME